MSAWQKIERGSSAPKDGDIVDLWFPRGIGRQTDFKFSTDPVWGPNGQWIKEIRERGEDLTLTYSNTAPTHWMPTPLPPEDSAS